VKIEKNKFSTAHKTLREKITKLKVPTELNYRKYLIHWDFALLL